MKKERVLSVLKQFPDEFTIDELIEKLIFVEKVEEGLAQAKNGETVSHEEIVLGVLMRKAEKSGTVPYKKVMKKTEKLINDFWHFPKSSKIYQWAKKYY